MPQFNLTKYESLESSIQSALDAADNATETASLLGSSLFAVSDTGQDYVTLLGLGETTFQEDSETLNGVEIETLTITIEE